MKRRQRNNLYSCFVLCAILLLMLSGCGMFQNVETQTQDSSVIDDKNYTVVGFSQIGSESVWRTANTNSIQNTLTKENGFFLMYNNARQKQENQIKALRGFISQRVDYIVFSPVTEDGWETVLQEAKDAGIPIILADRMVSVKDDSLYKTWIGTDARAEGEKAGRWLEQDLKTKKMDTKDINIVVLQGTVGSSVQLGRTMGFDSIADQHTNWHILQQQSAEFTTAKGKEVMELFLKRYPEIDVVVSQNDDMTFGALEAIQEAGLTTGVNGDITVISFDAVKAALEMVEAGTINVDIECNPEQGAYIEDVIKKMEQGEKVNKSYIVEEQVFTQDNVSDVLDSRTY